MSFLQDLKSLFQTGSRHPGDGITFNEVRKRPEDKVDAMATANGAENSAFGDSAAPVNWVPSQQDDRPRY
jgi:hypothetical protein